jgi:circadian clock protein KaiB
VISIPKPPPKIFKGIALFTPGGDLVYCIDSDKQAHWHVHLCGMLQQLLALSEPPHFLVPCYSATVDCVLDPETQQVQVIAEASPMILRHQSLLNTIFETEDVIWKVAPLHHKLCDPVVMIAHRIQFPKLWQNHDLVVRYEPAIAPQPEQHGFFQEDTLTAIVDEQNYVLKLFVSGINSSTEHTLKKLHRLLEEVLGETPYTLTVLDVGQHPQEAEFNLVSATPTLVRIHPHPIYRIVGSLDNADQLLGVLRKT